MLRRVNTNAMYLRWLGWMELAPFQRFCVQAESLQSSWVHGRHARQFLQVLCPCNTQVVNSDGVYLAPSEGHRIFSLVFYCFVIYTAPDGKQPLFTTCSVNPWSFFAADKFQSRSDCYFLNLESRSLPKTPNI